MGRTFDLWGYESYVAYQNKSLTVTSTPSEGVHVTLPDAPKKRKREHPMKGVNKSLLGEFSGSGQASAAMDVDSSELVSQLYSNIAKQIMDIPLALKGPPIHLGSGDKPQKTPRVILDLFPRYYETRDKVNILQAAVSPPGSKLLTLRLLIRGTRCCSCLQGLLGQQTKPRLTWQQRTILFCHQQCWLD